MEVDGLNFFGWEILFKNLRCSCKWVEGGWGNWGIGEQKQGELGMTYKYVSCIHMKKITYHNDLRSQIQRRCPCNIDKYLRIKLLSLKLVLVLAYLVELVMIYFFSQLYSLSLSQKHGLKHTPLIRRNTPQGLRC